MTNPEHAIEKGVWKRMTASDRRAIKLFSWLLLLSLPSRGPRAQSPEGSDVFETRIRPLLSANCLSCHGAQVQMAGLNLSTEAGLLKGSDKGPVVMKGDAENSRIIQAVRYLTDVKMPPTGKLTDPQISDLTQWVQQGAPWPVAQPLPGAGKNEKQSQPVSDFWSFQPVKAQPPPPVSRKGWVKSPIDNFILAKLKKEGLAVASPAGKLTLLRRATFDLTGLPPTEREIQEFLADDSAQAFDKVVARLLASPRYGERWGRHWLDVARYGDSTGGDEDYRNPYAWRYRDYVIQAFNADLPFDRFVVEQIAGDLLPAEKPGDVNTRGIVATGFLALGPKLLSEADKPKVLYDIIDEQIDVTSRGLMGITVACARCHDHKFDPIPTEDYYSLASIFASTKQLSKLEGITSKIYLAPLVPKDIAERYEAFQKKIAGKKEEIDEIVDEEAGRHAARLMPRLADYMVAAWKVYGASASAQEVALTEGLDPGVLGRWVEYLKPSDEARPHLDRWHKATADRAVIAREYHREFELTSKEWDETRTDWKSKVAAALKGGTAPPEKPKFKAGKNRFFSEVRFSKGPLALPENEKDQAPLFSGHSNERLGVLRQEMEILKKDAPPEPPMACAVAEGENVQQRVFVRGNPRSPAQEVPKRFPRVFSGEPQSPITQGSGRLELARWLASPNHPLTARVMVNRIWQWHFGEGLVRTPSNFGKLGEPPTHPELLDYLAQQFVASGWSVKSMHRLIMSSSTYQMSSAATPHQIQADPANRFWSHFSPRRLDVEEIRDTLLSVAGSLDLTVGGSLLEGTGIVHDKENDPVARVSLDPAKSRRRTIYLPLRRSNLPSLLTLFDFGDAVTTGENRSRTNVAPQALFMLNSKFVADRASDAAKLLLADKNVDDKKRIERGIWTILARKPSVQEINAALSYIHGMEAKRVGEESRLNAWQSYCRILMSSNEFVYID
jgi:Protein of unknown function (DUF1553)/Protein of unknown function (DUF1549)/Planctomycete cytochrome C